MQARGEKARDEPAPICHPGQSATAEAPYYMHVSPEIQALPCCLCRPDCLHMYTLGASAGHASRLHVQHLDSSMASDLCAEPL